MHSLSPCPWWFSSIYSMLVLQIFEDIIRYHFIQLICLYMMAAKHIFTKSSSLDLILQPPIPSLIGMGYNAPHIIPEHCATSIHWKYRWNNLKTGQQYYPYCGLSSRLFKQAPVTKISCITIRHINYASFTNHQELKQLLTNHQNWSIHSSCFSK